MNEWIDYAGILASIATVGAVFALVYELRLTRNMEKRQAALDTNDRWQELIDLREILFKVSWKDADEYFEKYPEDSREYIALTKVLLYFESLGEAVFNGLLDKSMAILQMGRPAIIVWQINKEIIKAIRDNITGDQNTYLYFEWFALQAEKTLPSLGKKLIKETELLRAEIGWT